MSNSKGCLTHLTKEETMVYTFRAYVSPILVIIGIPSNLLVILVFTIIERQTSCRFNLYAIWMAVAHNIQLIVNTLIDDFLGRGLKYATQCKHSAQVDIESSFLCKTLTYLTDASALIAAFILMLFSVDRVSTGVKYVLYLYIIGVAILPAIFIFITNILILYKLSTAIYRSKLIGAKDDESSNEMGKVIAHLAISILFTAFMPTFRHTLIDIIKCRHVKQHNHLIKHYQSNYFHDNCERNNLHQLEQITNIPVTDQETISIYSTKFISEEDFYSNVNGLNYNVDPIPFIDQYGNYSPEHYTFTR
ncbi:peptide (allatostatin somatostatin)-like receptor [Schistosoma japonicum]|uniref:Peptide (Allatostatin somatostatin)-like receptor n=1 Tax=Schistosoma japonicum TaxID=6182 RepID=A0A4Z2DSF7_SCHJA|nr:peptide (allatostatin somatostatin)-like receptor [Schistosoma japonicum]